MTQKIVINSCHGGFSLSNAAVELYGKLAGLNLVAAIQDRHHFTHWYRGTVLNENYFSQRDIPRDCPHLVAAVEQLGESASGRYSNLKVVEIPDGVSWHIAEYDGWEWIAEDHRTWN
jgi:hypothetical protein